MIFLTGIRIAGTGHYVPPMKLTNNDLAKLVETNDEWIRTRTGISTRHISTDEPTWYLGWKAAMEAISAAQITPDQIGLIIDATITSDCFTPATACIIQQKLGAMNAMAFDMNSACTGFVCAFDIAARYLATDPQLEYVLVVANETLSRIIDYNDRGSCILFGDGAGASVLTREEAALYSSYFRADGTGATALYAKSLDMTSPFIDPEAEIKDDIFTDMPDDHLLHQDGRAVYRFATEAMPSVVEEAAKRAGISVSDIDILVPHQANLRIIETAAKKLGFPMEKIFVNLEHYGNTSSATVPIALDEAVRGGLIKRGDIVCLTGFGAGLTMGAVIIRY